VAISRNHFDVTRSDIYYVNLHLGGDTATNPAPSVMTEELRYQWPPRTPEIT
jgi:hypothetical protein